jgi:predicted nucleic acid-binding protein
MPVTVVDASALGALVFGEPRAEEISARLSGGQMVAPALLWFELASICMKKIKAHPQLQNHLFDALLLALYLPIEVIEVDQGQTVKIANQTGLTTYDASYVWLAREVNGDLITLDKVMLRALKSKVKSE